MGLIFLIDTRVCIMNCVELILVLMEKNKSYDPSKANALYVLMMSHATKKKVMTSIKEVGKKRLYFTDNYYTRHTLDNHLNHSQIMRYILLVLVKQVLWVLPILKTYELRLLKWLKVMSNEIVRFWSVPTTNQ